MQNLVMCVYVNKPSHDLYECYFVNEYTVISDIAPTLYCDLFGLNW